MLQGFTVVQVFRTGFYGVLPCFTEVYSGLRGVRGFKVV